MTHVIIGAGPAGVSAGLQLARNGIAPLILEKDAVIGGLSKTLEFHHGGDTYRTDIGPHRFFSQNPALYQLIEELLGEDWVVVDRLTRQLIDGKYFSYPVDIMQALRNVDPLVAVHMILDFLQATARNVLVKPPKDTFEDWVVLNFGRRLAEFNMLNYTEKIWGIPCSRIAGSWANQRIKGMNAFDIVKKALISGGGPRSMVDSFYYPRRGIQQIYDAMAAQAVAGGGRIETRVNITKLHHDGARVTRLTYEKDGKAVDVDVDALISSMPITDLVTLLDPAVPARVSKAAAALGYRDQVQVFLIVDKPKITRDTWIYFPTTPPTFGRMMEPKNWHPGMSPEGKSSLLVEYFAFKGDATWNAPDDRLVKQTVHELEWLGFVRKEEVLAGHVMRIEKAYPTWDVVYQKRLARITGFLDTIGNLYCVGRNGRFFYNNQDHSIETGLLAAQSIIEGKKYDLDNIGMETTYFEAGMLYKKKGTTPGT